MKILVAPNSFKECADSHTIAEIISGELTRHWYKNIILSPLSDGGDGFLEVCKSNYSLKTKHFRIFDSISRRNRNINYGCIPRKNHYYLEVSDIIGLKNIPHKYRKPLEINSANLGVFLSKIKKQSGLNGKKKLKITIGIGGTGTSDLGLGLCEMFGLKLLDAGGRELSLKPKNYLKTTGIVLPQKLNIDTEVVLDVEAPLFGKKGTSRVFAPQKGADRNQVELLEAGVKNIIKILKKDFQMDFSKEKIGAGGGICLGLSLLANLKIKTAREFILDDLGLKKKIEKCDLVITGEGSFDKQSYMNKATGIILNESLKMNKRVIVITGRKTLLKFDGSVKVFDIESLFSSKEESIRKYRQGIKTIVKSLVNDSEFILNRKGRKN